MKKKVFNRECAVCEKCFDFARRKSKCCECNYMVILEWERWHRHCYLHDTFCEFLEDDGCDDFKQMKG